MDTQPTSARRPWTLRRPAWTEAERIQRHQDHLLLLLTLLIGAVVGLVVVAFILVTERLGSRLYPADGSAWRRLAMPVAGALVSGLLLARYFPGASGSGIPQTKVALFLEEGRIRLRTVVGKFVCSSISLASGIALGREGPTVQVGAGIASVFGRRLGLGPRRVQSLVPIGTAAALAAAFNTPISAVLFTLEEILGDLHARVLGSVVISAATSWAVLHLVLGDEPLFHVPAYQLVHPLELGIYAVLGIVGGLVSVVFVKLLLGLRLRFLALPARTRWVAAGRRRAAGGPHRLVRAGRARRRLRPRGRGAERPDGAGRDGAAAGAEGRGDGDVLRVRERRRDLRTEPVHRGHARRRGRQRRARLAAGRHGQPRRLRAGRHGHGVRRHRPRADDVGHHDLRDHPRLLDHRAADDRESPELLHLRAPAARARVRGAAPPGAHRASPDADARAGGGRRRGRRAAPGARLAQGAAHDAARRGGRPRCAGRVPDPAVLFGPRRERGEAVRGGERTGPVEAERRGHRAVQSGAVAVARQRAPPGAWPCTRGVGACRRGGSVPAGGRQNRPGPGPGPARVRTAGLGQGTFRGGDRRVSRGH